MNIANSDSGPAPDGPIIVITGFMGTGKTVVGRALAELLGLEFIDTDQVIETETGSSISDLFRDKGERHFRDLERSLAKRLAARRGVVIATGGGMLLDPTNYALFEPTAEMVLLHASLDTLCERLIGDGTRPVLSNASGSTFRAKIEHVLQTRAPFYDRFDLRVDTTKTTPPLAAAQVASHLYLPTTKVPINPLRKFVDDRDTPLGRHGMSHLEIGRGVASKLGQRLHELDLTGRAFLIVPEHLKRSFIERVAPSLEDASIEYSVATIQDGDTHKTVSQFSAIIDQLVSEGAHRDTTIVAMGGGVTGDLGGFVASAYMRGVPFVQVPTTVLAQVDASIGGKVGVNHAVAKNLIGAFYQPALILSDPATLTSLPFDEISNGMAEVVKSALIRSESLFSFLESQMQKDALTLFRDAVFLETSVCRAAVIKAELVNEDPYEKGPRRLLNLGHTVGHALEAIDNYKGLKHGQAVSLGMIVAMQIAVSRGAVKRATLDRTYALLEWCGLPTRFDDVNPDRLAKAMRLDKKFAMGKLHFVLPTGIGRATVVDDVTISDLIAVIERGAL